MSKEIEAVVNRSDTDTERTDAAVRRADTVTITMDGRTLEVGRDLTILQAAERNDIYLPTLCAHQDLTPFGGCRMCLVEVEGAPGLVTACTTPVREGLTVSTRSVRVQAERMEILQLILSDHTSSCLICDEKDECKEFMGTIRKAGVTTGCRYCPNDGRCELQDVVEWMGVKELKYPARYRHRRVEKEDPFYDRDYNLCILCGRCVRMCQEIRTANTLAFKERGRQTVIGPAYERTHVDAGCEFCGACISVCPTGALSERAGKWHGKPEREVTTTCPLCGMGCQMRLLLKGDSVVGSLPAEDPLVNEGQLCVKGRFCVSELVTDYRRIKRPYRTEGASRVDMTWEAAVELAADRLSSCPPEKFGMVVSADCSNEDLYVAQKFVRVVMRSHKVDNTSRLFYGPGLGAYLKLMGMGVSLGDLRRASAILCIGLDARYGKSVVGVGLRKAIRRGARVFTIHPRHHSVALIADKWLQPDPGKELDILRSLVGFTAKDESVVSRPRKRGKAGTLETELVAVAEMLAEASAPVILIGGEFLRGDGSPQVLEAVAALARNVGAGVLALPAQGNLFGSIQMGSFSELLPGGRSSGRREALDDLAREWNADIPPFSSPWNLGMLTSRDKLGVLYMLGDVPPSTERLSDFSIFQNFWPPDPEYPADLVLPTAVFTEVDATFTSGEGRVERVRKGVDPPGQALPDWKILSMIAQEMGRSGFDYSQASEIHKEISRVMDGFSDFDAVERKPAPLIFEGELTHPPSKPVKKLRADKRYPFVLVTSSEEHTHRGLPLSTWVGGLQVLMPQGVVTMNPEDAREADVSPGDEVVVSSSRVERIWPVRITMDQPRGTLHVVLRPEDEIGPNPQRVRMRKKDV